MKSIVCILIAVILIVPAISSSPSKGEANDVKLTSEDANSFLMPLHKFGFTLHHECYVEGCVFEEVAETKGTTKEAYEYFFTYTCTKFGSHCKVRCTHRKDCSVGNWGGWRGYVNAQKPGCYEQTRSKPFKHPLQTTYRRMSCGGLRDTCGSPPTEKRKQCVCRKANCRPGSWKQWTGDIEEGSCGQQTRTRPFILTWLVAQQTGSCGGIATTCPPPESEHRKMCSCSKADCTLMQWSTWKGAVEKGACAEQTRTRGYSKSVNFESHLDKCPTLPQECPEASEQTRKMCSCKYARCSLGEWSEWEPKELKQDQCDQEQTRRRTYSLTIAYRLYADKCPSLPQICPDDRLENRTQCGPTSEPVITTEAPARGGPTSEPVITTEAPARGGLISEPVITTEAPARGAQSAKYESLGCFKDRGGRKSKRPLPVLIANLRKNIDWKNLNNTIQACADKAKAEGLEYFALQYYGECWSGPNAGETYAKYGRSKKGCTRGVGKKKSNAVYRITNL